MKKLFLLAAALLCFANASRAAEIKIETDIKAGIEYRMLSIQSMNYANIYLIESPQGAIVVTNQVFPNDSRRGETYIFVAKKFERVRKVMGPVQTLEWRTKKTGVITGTVPALKDANLVTSIP